MKEFILGKSLINVNSVTNALVKQENLGGTKDFTLEKGLMNVNSVASLLAEKKT